MEEQVQLNLWQKIVQVRMIAEGFSKDKKSYGYSYVSGNQVLSKIKDKMNELNLLLMPSTQVGEHHSHAYKTAKGKDALDFVVKGQMSYTWINGDAPDEREVVTWAYYGQQDEISKAFGSGLTYSERYYLLKSLGLPTDEDDPESKETQGNTQSQSGKNQNKNQNQNQNQNQPSVALKSKWKLLNNDSLDGFNEWVTKKTSEKWSYADMERALTTKIQEKKTKEEEANA
ncbi:MULTISPECIES: ERF family protein [Paenibacillus]|uniref:ERF superfamily protein n=1 Tax=Paenibacillus pabuli TaxID=1472 RepID=A0A855XR89_9BACL|nr:MULTISPECIES: ERF family protein [Paenibacillus]PWW37347.1 ERF superfamily protein [Paenibacillus pabuli]PXW05489.1 ERF superfamily protein [Paenibacillus taichungensis]